MDIPHSTPVNPKQDPPTSKRRLLLENGIALYYACNFFAFKFGQVKRLLTGKAIAHFSYPLELFCQSVLEGFDHGISEFKKPERVDIAPIAKIQQRVMYHMIETIDYHKERFKKNFEKSFSEQLKKMEEGTQNSNIGQIMAGDDFIYSPGDNSISFSTRMKKLFSFYKPNESYRTELSTFFGKLKKGEHMDDSEYLHGFTKMVDVTTITISSTASACFVMLSDLGIFLGRSFASFTIQLQELQTKSEEEIKRYKESMHKAVLETLSAFFVVREFFNLIKDYYTEFNKTIYETILYPAASGVFMSLCQITAEIGYDYFPNINHFLAEGQQQYVEKLEKDAKEKTASEPYKENAFETIIQTSPIINTPWTRTLLNTHYGKILQACYSSAKWEYAKYDKKMRLAGTEDIKTSLVKATAIKRYLPARQYFLKLIDFLNTNHYVNLSRFLDFFLLVRPLPLAAQLFASKFIFDLSTGITYHISKATQKTISFVASIFNNLSETMTHTKPTEQELTSYKNT